MLSDCELSGLDLSTWITPLVSGVVRFGECEVAGINIQMWLISRRSVFQQGTRYNVRGIDQVHQIRK